MSTLRTCLRSEDFRESPRPRLIGQYTNCLYEYVELERNILTDSRRPPSPHRRCGANNRLVNINTCARIKHTQIIQPPFALLLSLCLWFHQLAHISDTPGFSFTRTFLCPSFLLTKNKDRITKVNICFSKTEMRLYRERIELFACTTRMV